MKIYVDAADLLAHFAEMEDPLVVEGDPLASRDNLARWLSRYCEERGGEPILVFDGATTDDVLPPMQRFGKTKVINMPEGEHARNAIARRANRAAQSERTSVVTADWRLIEALERGRAKTLSPAQFVAHVRKTIGKDQEALANEPDEKFTGLTDDEVSFWLEYFDDQG